MKRALTILEFDPEIKKMFENFNLSMAPFEIEHETWHKEFLSRVNARKEAYFTQLGEVLVKRGVLDEAKVDFFIKDGVLYMGQQEEERIGEMLKQAFENKFGPLDDGEDQVQ